MNERIEELPNIKIIYDTKQLIIIETINNGIEILTQQRIINNPSIEDVHNIIDQIPVEKKSQFLTATPAELIKLIIPRIIEKLAKTAMCKDPEKMKELGNHYSSRYGYKHSELLSYFVQEIMPEEIYIKLNTEFRNGSYDTDSKMDEHLSTKTDDKYTKLIRSIDHKFFKNFRTQYGWYYVSKLFEPIEKRKTMFWYKAFRIELQDYLKEIKLII